MFQHPVYQFEIVQGVWDTLYKQSYLSKQLLVTELDVLKQDLETKLGTEFQNKLQRARSLSESTSESEQTPAGKHNLYIF